MKSILRYFSLMVVACVVLSMSGCTDPKPLPPVGNPPSIGIHEPEFDKESMTLKVLIAPSTDALAWYWKIEAAGSTSDFTMVDGAAAVEVSCVVEYGIEYTISAYAENDAGCSSTATKRYCPMPDAAAIAIGEISLDKESMKAECSIYPSEMTTLWYWRVVTEPDSEVEWTSVEGNSETTLNFDYAWGTTAKVEAYAENVAGASDIVSKEAYFEPEEATIEVGEAKFDSETMMVTIDVTPSESTTLWGWSLGEDAEPTAVEGNAPASFSFEVEYDTDYLVNIFAQNAVGKGEKKSVELRYNAPLPAMVEIAVAKATAYTVDVRVDKAEHCVHYVVGAMLNSTYDAELFTTQAQSSLNPDPSYPFATFLSATDSATFTEQNLLHNARADAVSSGIELRQGESYTIAVYAEDSEGRSELYAIEHTVPEAIEGEPFGLSLAMSDEQVGQTWAKATVAAPVASKLFVGLLPFVSTSAEEPFTFEGKSDEECREHILDAVCGVPEVVTATEKEYTLSEDLTIENKYVAYAVAIDPENERINVAYNIFSTTAPSLSGSAHVTGAYISKQTSVESLSILLNVDKEAVKTRIYAAPATDHAAYADHMEQIMDSSEYQNYREEYTVSRGTSYAAIDIYHPGADYYIYAVAIDKEGKAGPMVNIAQLAGGTNEYYTTASEIAEEEPEEPENPEDPGDSDPYAKYFTGTGTVEIGYEVTTDSEEELAVKFTLVSKSENVAGVWLHRIEPGHTTDIKKKVLEDFKEYPDKISGTSNLRYRDLMTYTSYTERYMQRYDANYGGTIISVVVADNKGKLSINFCYVAGEGVVEL